MTVSGASGFRVVPHSHSDHVDSFDVLEGEAEFVMGDETVLGGPGSYVAAPIGVVHGFRNAGDGELRMLNVHAPNTGFAVPPRALDGPGFLERGNGNSPRMRRTLYALLGWIAWKYATRTMRRRVRRATPGFR